MYRNKLLKSIQAYVSPPTSPVAAQPSSNQVYGMDQLLISSAVGAAAAENNDALAGAATIEELDNQTTKKPVRLGRAVSSDGVKLATKSSGVASSSASSSTAKKSSVLNAKKSKFKRRGKLGKLLCGLRNRVCAHKYWTVHTN